MKTILPYKFIMVAALFFLSSPFTCKAYSVLTHEALIDAAWDHSLKPLLLKKYPGITDGQLKEAHAYVYGGAVAPDMGYYPFGNVLYTNLVHYVRSGEFVEALLVEAQNVNEYAFALGSLCHYNADTYGHSLGTNRCVPLVYPTEKAKFGDVVTYADDHTSHIRMEFAFDVLQTARGNYASQAYHDFIGFKVARPVLERAFLKTYGIDINSIFGNLSLSIETFRWVVKNIFPTITRTAWETKKSDIRKLNPGITAHKFMYRMRRANYNKEFGKGYKKPGFLPTVISVLVRIVPKIGPLKALKFKAPGQEGEKLFIQSFDTALAHYVVSVKEAGDQKIVLPDVDFDTGKKTAPCEYPLADDTYSQWLLKLKDKNFDSLDIHLKQNILNFYRNPNAPTATKSNVQDWSKVQQALEELKSAHLNGNSYSKEKSPK